MIHDAGGGIDPSIPRIGLSRRVITVHTSRALLVKVARACTPPRLRFEDQDLTALRYYSRRESREGVKKVKKERKDQEIFTNWRKGKIIEQNDGRFLAERSNFDIQRCEKSVKRRLRSRASSERKVVCHCSLCRLFPSEYQIEGTPSTLSEFLKRKEQIRRGRRETTE